MATLVQQTAELFADTASSIAPSITGVTAGNLVGMLVACSQNVSNTAISAPASWSTATSGTGPGSGGFRQQTSIFYKENAASGSHSGTVTASANSYFAAIIVEFSGSKTSSALDAATNQSNNGVTTGSTGSVSNTTANALVLVAICASNDTGTMTGLSTPASTGYTNIDGELSDTAHTGYQFSYKNVSAIASQDGTWTWTNASGYGGAIAIFGDAVSSPIVTAQPTDQTVNDGATATFSVTATGATSYQWKKNGTNIGGATSSSVNIAGAYSDQSAQITVDCINAGGTTTSNAATLRVAFKLSGTGPRTVTRLGGPFGAGSFESDLRSTASAGGGGAVGTAAETDTAFPRGSARPAGVCTEAESALAPAGLQLRAVGLSSEADAAIARTALQIRAAGLATEADSALAVSGAQLRAAGLGAETDTALARSAVQSRAAGLAAETDTALALLPGATGAVGLAFETDTALPRGSARPVALAAETDTALALSAVSIRSTGLAGETDAALGRGVARPVGLAAETDIALPLGAGASSAVGMASETDSALPRGSARPATLAAETETALARAAVQIRAVGLAVEADTAVALSSAAGSSAGLASETDTALPRGSARPVGRAAESNTALGLAASLIRSAGLAAEADVAFALAGLARRGVGVAVETDTALQLFTPGAQPAGRAQETDAAIALQAVAVPQGRRSTVNGYTQTPRTPSNTLSRRASPALRRK